MGFFLFLILIGFTSCINLQFLTCLMIRGRKNSGWPAVLMLIYLFVKSQMLLRGRRVKVCFVKLIVSDLRMNNGWKKFCMSSFVADLGF